MKLDELELSLLFDYYGELLTEKQRTCFELYYNQDFSLGEIAQEAGISRQAVHDALVRAEGSLRLMEVKIGAAARDLTCRRAADRIRGRQRSWPAVRNRRRRGWLGRFWMPPVP